MEDVEGEEWEGEGSKGRELRRSSLGTHKIGSDPPLVCLL